MHSIVAKDVDTGDEETNSVGISFIKIGQHIFKFKFQDIGNYLAGRVSYLAFLEAYKNPETKSYFHYEWFDHPGKLDFLFLPPYETF